MNALVTGIRCLVAGIISPVIWIALIIGFPFELVAVIVAFPFAAIAMTRQMINAS